MRPQRIAGGLGVVQTVDALAGQPVEVRSGGRLKRRSGAELHSGAIPQAVEEDDEKPHAQPPRISSVARITRTTAGGTRSSHGSPHAMRRQISVASTRFSVPGCSTSTL